MRKTIVIFGIIMAFILGSLVSAPSVTAVAGGLPEEIDAIWEIIVGLQDQLNDLHVTWEKVTDKPYEVLHYEQNSSVTVPKTTVRPDLLKLAVWKIEKNSTFAHDITRVIFDSSVYANVEQPSSPSCAIQIGWYKSEDGMDWKKSIDIITATNDIFDLKSSFDVQNFLESESNFIAFGTRNSGTCESDGVVKEFSGTLTIHLSPGQSLNQTLP